MNYLKVLIIYLIIILVLHVVPTSTGNGLVLSKMEILYFRADYLLHTLVFLPWMILVWLHLNHEKRTGRKRRRQAWAWFTGGLLLVIFSEALQIFIPGRGFNPLDIASSALGIMLGSLIFLFSANEKKRGKH